MHHSAAIQRASTESRPRIRFPEFGVFHSNAKKNFIAAHLPPDNTSNNDLLKDIAGESRCVLNTGLGFEEVRMAWLSPS